MAEEDKLLAAVVCLGIFQNRDGVRNDELVAVLVGKVTEFFEFLVLAVSPVVIQKNVIAVGIEKFREREIPVVVLGHAVENDHGTLDFRVGVICVDCSLVLVFLSQYNLVDSHNRTSRVHRFGFSTDRAALRMQILSIFYHYGNKCAII